MIATKETIFIKDVKDIPWDVIQEMFNEQFRELINNDDLVSLTLDHLLSDGEADLFDYMETDINEMLNVCLINNVEIEEGDSAFDHAVQNQPLNKYGYMINFVVKALVATSYENFKVDFNKSNKDVIYVNSYRINLKEHEGTILGLFHPRFIKRDKVKVNRRTVLPLLKLLKEYIDANKVEGRRYLEVDDVILSKKAVDSLPDKYLKMNSAELTDFANKKLRQMEYEPKLEGSLLDVALGRQSYVESLDLETAKTVADYMKILSYDIDNVIDKINLLKIAKRLKLSIYKLRFNR